MTFRVDRNLQTFAPLLIAVTGAIILRCWRLGWVARAGLVPLVALQAIWGGDAIFYSAWDRMASAARLIRGGYDGKRRERFEYRSEYRQISNALPREARVLLHTSRRSLGIDREIVLDWVGQQGLFDYRAIRGQRELFEYYRARGVTHLLHEGNSSFPSESKQESILFTEFVRRYGKGHRSFGVYELVEMPVEPPPRDRPVYTVLSIGLGGYPDGLYSLDSMNVIERLPQHLLRFPIPQKAVGSDEAVRLDALGRADAVTVGSGTSLGAELQAALGSGFFVGINISGAYAIYYPNILRRQ
jgi:hypothetical protein